MIERQIRYYVSTDIGDQIRQRHEWIFLIVNTSTEIKRIRDRISFQLAPIDNVYEHYDKIIQESRGLRCRIFSFSSDIGKIFDKSKIYNSPNFHLDRELSIKRDGLGWELYADGIVEEDIELR
jgi:hypothetical protein